MANSASKQNTFEKPYLLIVEGKDDVNFFEAYLGYLSSLENCQGVNDKFDIYSIGGKNNLPSILKTISKTPGFNNIKALAIILDADSNPKARFQSITNALKKANLPSPRKIMEASGKKPKVMIFLLPDSNRAGSLEDLCLESIKNDPALSCIDKYFECLSDKKIKISANCSKAKCLAFLASRPDLPNNVGIAAKQKIWPFASPAFQNIKNFLINFFSL